jgi:glucose-6-phosphate isomerase
MLTQILHTPPIDPNDIKKLSELKQQMRDCYGIGAMAWVSTPQQVDDIPDIISLANEYKHRCDHVVLCGTGGSSLGAKTLIELVSHPLHMPETGTPTIHICEATDPEALDAIFALPAERTGWIFISKSGNTLETLAQFLAYLEFRAHHATGPALVITMEGERPLRQLAEQYGIPVYNHAADLGGRFSVFSIVGLLPAAIAGVDITNLRQGGVSMLDNHGLEMAANAAAWQMACLRDGQDTQIVMPYTKRLTSWSGWYRQLWAESLGKDGKGSTPLAAIGPIDHHSMLQLFLDGPANKSVTVLTIECPESAAHLPVPEALSEYAYLAASTPQTIINAQAYGTIQSFLNRGIPLRQLILPRLGAHELGELLMLGMVETVFTAALLQIDAFNQPAVEESKRIAFQCLNRASAA